MKTLCIEDLKLEPQLEAHADEMYAILCDAAIYEFEGDPPPSLTWLRERFRKLETRRSADGEQTWLNWVIRLRGGDAAGFVQATLRKDGSALIAYVMTSRYWGRGYAHRAVRAMMDELAGSYGVREFAAIFKRTNLRSRRLLERLGFEQPSAQALQRYQLEPDEIVMEMHR